MSATGNFCYSNKKRSPFIANLYMAPSSSWYMKLFVDLCKIGDTRLSLVSSVKKITWIWQGTNCDPHICMLNLQRSFVRVSSFLAFLWLGFSICQGKSIHVNKGIICHHKKVAGVWLLQQFSFEWSEKKVSPLDSKKYFLGSHDLLTLLGDFLPRFLFLSSP